MRFAVHPTPRRRVRPAAWLGLGLALALATGLVSAQVLYRSVDTQGRVSFSDRPSPGAVASALPQVGASPLPAPAGLDLAALPPGLRPVVRRYPATLYTSDPCAPCGAARQLLLQRGVPFVEKTVTTAQDADALQALNGSLQLPLLTLAGHHLTGFNTSDWQRSLDAAGYPARSQLPTGYRPAAAQPLTPPRAPAPVASPAVAAQETPPAAPVAPVAAPARGGIRF